MQQLLSFLIALNGMLPAAADPATTRASVPAGWTPDVKAATAFANRRSGRVAFAVRTDERSWGRRPDHDVSSASVIKAMLLVAYLRHPDVRGRDLTAADRGLLAPMIRYSDNDSATRVHAYVGAGVGVTAVAERAGMKDFRPDPAWGRSQIDARDQSRFFLRLPDLVPRRHRGYALRLLGGIVPEQRWGVAKAVPRGWTLHFKGGWGSIDGEVSHQVGLLRRGRQRVSIAILTEAGPTHAYSEQTLEGVARRLVRGLERAPRPVPATEQPTASMPAIAAPDASAAPDATVAPDATAAPAQRIPMTELSPTMKR